MIYLHFGPHLKITATMYKMCVAARCYFYLPPPCRPDTKPHWGCKEEDEYMCNGQAWIYCGTVPFVAEGGFHSE